jgi:TPR repeat protein
LEAARREAAQQEATRQEAARQEAARLLEAARPEGARPEEAAPEAARSEGARSEAAAPERARPEGAQSDAALPERARSEGAQPGARPEGAQPGAAQPEGTRPEEARHAAPQPAAADDRAWSDAERRQAQSDLTALGYYHGPINGIFDPNTRSAIHRWQAFTGAPETDHLANEQRDRISRDAESQTVLLKVSSRSPRGTAADTVKGGQARFARGSAFERGEGRPKDPAEAAYWYALAANDGWAPAFTNLGTLVARGQGTFQPDVAAAQRLWMTAAALGDGTALFNLGALAEHGIGGPVDLSIAKRWYARGAERKSLVCAASLKRLGG